MHTSTARRLGFGIAVTLAATLTIRPIFAEDPVLRRSSSLTVDHSYYPIVISPQRMLAQLSDAAEISLLQYGDTTSLYKVRSESTGEHPVLVEIGNRPDLRRLPLIRDEECQLSAIRAQHLSRVSKSMRNLFGSMSHEIGRYGFDHKRVENGLEIGAAESDGPLMLQILQCEQSPFRTLLVEQLARSNGPVATKALAHRCVFELDPSIRRDVVHLSKGRVSPEARQFLLDALRHPYAPFADHAATALAAIGDRESVPTLVKLLDLADPAAPTTDAEGNPIVNEIVKINHARNCQLCHAPSWDRSDPARVAVPLVTSPLPPSFSVAYYDEGGPGPFVRADVTYFRQEFSLTLEVAKPGPWPKSQRYDFFVRPRPALEWEILNTAATIDYPQRYAVLRALRKITDRDFGNQSDAWRTGLRKEGRFKL